MVPSGKCIRLYLEVVDNNQAAKDQCTLKGGALASLSDKEDCLAVIQYLQGQFNPLSNVFNPFVTDGNYSSQRFVSSIHMHRTLVTPVLTGKGVNYFTT